MSDLNASALLSNLKRILPTVAARRAACLGDLAREAHESLERELNQLIALLTSDDEEKRTDAEWYRHVYAQAAAQSSRRSRVGGGRVPPERNVSGYDGRRSRRASASSHSTPQGMRLAVHPPLCGDVSDFEGLSLLGEAASVASLSSLFNRVA